MTPTTRLLRIAFAAALLTLPSSTPAADCPNIVVYEPTGVGVVDAGWTGREHDLPLVGPTLNLTVDCGPPSPPCGTCAITGIVGSPQRCADDTSKTCSVATEIADCGSAGSCRTHLAPPQSIAAVFTSLCITQDTAGPVGGTIDIESGAFAPAIPVHSNVFFGVGNQGCSRCVGDPVANDGVRAGTCDAGSRMGLDCDANATSGLTDFGSTSFDCPLGSGLSFAGLELGTLPASTGTLTRTLGPASPNCPSLGGVPCFCAQCNNNNAEPCFTNGDCPPSGGNPGICGGRMCIGGSNQGSPCTTNSECPGGGICNRRGEPYKPNACLDDTSGDDCFALPGGEGECMGGPVDTYCSNHPNRYCILEAECDGGTCDVKNRECFPDNGVPGASITVSGTATPPVADVADPTDLAVLGCLPSTGSAVINNIGGLPGLVRGTYPGRLRIIDPAIPTPIPTPTFTPLATVTATPVPIASPCSAAPAPCRPPFVIGKSSVRLVDHLSGDKDRLQWKWNKGTATSLGELGDPMTSDDYALCLYDDADLRATIEIPAGGTCRGKPCWRAKSTGFQYRNKDALPDGITQLTLRAGADGKASLQAKGAGVPLPMPVLDLITGTLRVQLRNRTSGLCWDTTFSQPFLKHSAEQIKDKAD